MTGTSDSDGQYFPSEVRNIFANFAARPDRPKATVDAALAIYLGGHDDDAIDTLCERAEARGLSPDVIQMCLRKAQQLAADQQLNGGGQRSAKDKAIFDREIGRHNGIYQSVKGGIAEQPDPAPDIITLQYFDEFTTAATSKLWLIKNVMAHGEISSWIAPPGGGKSAALTDIAVHGGAFPEWRGYRVKQRFGTVYFALERANLVKLRLKAYRIRDDLSGIPIAVAGQVVDLMDKTCVGPIVDAIKRAEDNFKLQVGLAVFDTWSKGIAAGSGDENSAKDQNIALANLRRVIDQVSIHIATIGHTGKDEKKGQRGSNAKQADDDVEVQISGDTVKVATVNKANDQQQGAMTSFSLEPYVFGLDEDGDEERTFILSRKALPKVAAIRLKLSDNQKVAMQSLTEALLSQGVPAPVEYQLPGPPKAITLDQYKTELERQGVIDKHGSNPRSRFSELCKGLKARQLIGLRDEWVWDART
jgi:hypothetical protein